MNSDSHKPDAEEVLLAFSVEPDQGPKTLERYLRDYPELATELFDLSIDLRLYANSTETDEDIDSSELDRAWALYNELVADPNAELSDADIRQIDSSLISPSMREIGLPISILRSIKSGLVQAQGFPVRWLTKISAIGGYTTGALQLYLDRHPRLAPSASFKSDVKPSVGKKVSFAELVSSTDLTDEQKAEILREE